MGANCLWKVTFYGKSAPKILNTLKKTKIWFNKANYRLMKVKSIAECSKGSILQYFRPFIKLPFAIKIFVLSILEWQFYTRFTVVPKPFTHEIIFCKSYECLPLNCNTITWKHANSTDRSHCVPQGADLF